MPALTGQTCRAAPAAVMSSTLIVTYLPCVLEEPGQEKEEEEEEEVEQ